MVPALVDFAVLLFGALFIVTQLIVPLIARTHVFPMFRGSKGEK